MKRLLLLFSFLLSLQQGFSQGWPSKYQGVMLQAFYWDSYEDTHWTKLQSQADVISRSFNSIWVPQSGYCNTGLNGKSIGYNPVWWFNQNSSFGTQEELKEMIAAFNARKVAVIEDVVINHKSGDKDWCDFPEEEWKGKKLKWSLADICRDDEANEKFPVSGNYDTGDHFGYRDLDHKGENVQKNVKTYLQFLKEEMGYKGFRYDMVKGYGAEFIKIYNEDAKPEFSVGEYWDTNYDNVVGWIKGTGYTSAAFDFPLKYIINDAFGNGNWGALTYKGVAGDPNMSRYAVTFIDNHDTYRNENGEKLQNNVLAANAFILAMPGTPCIFLPHWKAYQTELEKMIAARKEAGISNQSRIVSGKYYDGGYVTIVQGERSKIMVVSGYPKGVDTEGYTLVSAGTAENPNYAFYKETNPAKDITVYVEANEQPLYLYAWTDNDSPLTDGYPGTLLTKKRQVGDKVFYYMTLKADRLNFLLNKGSDATKTDDVRGITNDVFYTYNNRKATDNTAQYKNERVIGEVDPLTFSNSETAAFFESPASWGKAACWAWDSHSNYTGGSWPGQQCEYIGKAANGNKIWKWTCTVTGTPANIMFNDGVATGTQKSNEYAFTNGGYYTMSERTGTGSNTDNLFEREFKGKVKSTLCLPFNVSPTEAVQLDGKIYQLTGASDGVFTFKPCNSIEAFKPYVFIANSTAKCLSPFRNKTVLSGNTIPATIGDYTFAGTMTKVTKVSTAETSCFIYTAANGSFVKANSNGGVVIPAYRCYFQTKSDAAAPAKVQFINESTGLSTLTLYEDDNIYTLQGVCLGRRSALSDLPKGIYIYKGRKILK